MHTTKKYLTVAALVAAVLAVAACGDLDPEVGAEEPTPTAAPIPSEVPAPAPTPTAPPEPSRTPVETPQPSLDPVDWSDPGLVVDLGGGVSIGACEGGAPLLCVAQVGVVVGNLEALRFPLDSFDVVDPSSDDLTNLRAIAEAFVAAFAADRAQGCGPDYELEPLPVTEMTLGAEQGLRYGFVGRTAHGTPSELNIQYAAVSGGELVLITAIAYDEGGCPGRDDTSGFDSAGLLAVSGQLDAVLEISPLPEVR